MTQTIQLEKIMKAINLQRHQVLHPFKIVQAQSEHQIQQAFKKREYIPLDEGILWQIEVGVVRTLTLAEDGTIIPLGFWGVGEVIGQPLACIQPYQIECLTNVKAIALRLDEFWDLHQVMLSHIHQMQELFRVRHGLIQQRLLQFLEWLANKFGFRADQGRLIPLRLTHQDLADVLGTTRVTITKSLQQLQQQKIISLGKHQILLHDRP
jgi:CRP-like cAMP-binding protein